jgi:ATP-dependent Clp protease ATP-binding subunit ClpC
VSKQAVQKRFVARRVPGDSKALFTRFDDEARAVVVDSMERAREGRHAEVNTGHIVLALLTDEEGRAACLLKSSGVPTDRVRTAIVEALGPGQEEPPEHLPWAPDAKKVLELSLREAFRRQAAMIGPEHILLGVLRDTTSLGGMTLAEHGADRRKISDSAG